MASKKEKPKPEKRTIAIATELHERLAHLADKDGFLVGRLAETLLAEAMDARRSGKSAA